MKGIRAVLFVLVVVLVSRIVIRVAFAPTTLPQAATTTPSVAITVSPVVPPAVTTPPQKKTKQTTPAPPTLSSKSPVIPPHITTPPPVVFSPPTIIPPSNNDVYNYALARTVSLFCSRTTNETTIATAFFVHESGILLTNGHVTEGTAKNTCVIRQGAPAREIGTATLRYLPAAYTATTTYQGQAPEDISLWSYEPRSDFSPKRPLPVFSFALAMPQRGTVVTTFSFPAELVSFTTLINNQYPLFSDATIKEYDHTAVALTGDAAAQKGSSGGVVINPANMEALGIIFGVSDIGPIGNRTLYALTYERINTIIEHEFGKSFLDYVAGIAH